MTKVLKNYWLLFFIFIIFLHSVLLFNLKLFPYPELFVYPYLAENGFLPYKNIFDQHFPSIIMMPLNLYDFGLRSAFSARIFLLGLVILNHVFLFLIAKKLLKSPKKALIANFFYLILQPIFEGSTLWLDSFLVPVLLASFYFTERFIYKKSWRDALLGGFFLGVSIFLKQVMLPLAFAVLIYLYIKTKDIKSLAPFLLAAVVPVLVLIFWVISKDIFEDFWYWTVTFNFEVYAKMGRKLPTLNQVARVFIYWLPAAYWTFKNRERKESVLLGIFAIFSLATAVSRFELVHLQPSLPFAVILLTAILSSVKFNLRLFYIFVLVLATVILSLRFYRANLGKSIYFFDSTTLETSVKVKELTDPKDKIFVLGAQPTIYFLSERLPGGNTFTVNLPWNMKVAQDKILEGLLMDMPKVAVRDSTAEIDGKSVLEFSAKLNNFIEEHYEETERIGSNEIFILKER